MPHQITQWDCCKDSGWTFEFDDLVLEIENDIFDLPKVTVTTSMPRTHVDPLRQKLRRIVSKALDMDGLNMTHIAVMLLQLVEEAVIFLHQWKFLNAKKNSYNQAWLRDKGDRGWNVQEAQSISVLYENDLGADLDTIDESGDDCCKTVEVDDLIFSSRGVSTLYIHPVYKLLCTSVHSVPTRPLRCTQ